MDKIYQQFLSYGLPEDAALALSWKMVGRPMPDGLSDNPETREYYNAMYLADGALQEDRRKAEAEKVPKPIVKAPKVAPTQHIDDRPVYGLIGRPLPMKPAQIID